MGYSILDVSNGKVELYEAGVIKFKAKDLKGQIAELDRGLDEIIKGKKIDSVAIEDIFFAYNPKSIIKLAQFRGALLLKIVQTLGDYSEYTPLEVNEPLREMEILKEAGGFYGLKPELTNIHTREDES